MEMTKQQFIDKTPVNDYEKLVQTFLERTSKTKTLQLLRVINEITTLCPKTWMKETGIETYHMALTTANELNSTEDQLES